jgi:hypothetical protein
VAALVCRPAQAIRPSLTSKVTISGWSTNRNTEQPEGDEPQSRLWRLWSTEPRLLVGLGGLLVGVAAVAGLFLNARGDAQPTPPADPTATTAAASTSSTSGSETTTSDLGSTAEAAAETTEAVTVQAVKVQIGDYHRVGSGLYQLAGSSSLQLRYWWTTMTSFGTLESSDTSCTVVGTVTNLGTRAVEDTARSATCSLQGWQQVYLPPGNYRITVMVTLNSGARGSGSSVVRVVP